MIVRLPLPPFLPDQSTNSGVLHEAENVIPRTEGYGPLFDLTGFTNALAGTFKGGASFIANDGNATLLAGTASALYRLSSASWSALATGLSVTGQWRFAQFGNYVIAVNGSLTKVVDLLAGTASTLAGAPAGIAVAVVGDYAVIGQDTGGRLNVYTSGFNDHTDWNPAGTGGATIQPMLAGGEVMGLAGGEYGVILQRQSITRMSRTGDATAPFQYDKITDNIGCAAKASVAAVGRSVFFLSDRGFMVLEDGQAIKPIGSEKVDRTFQAIVPRDDYERMFVAVDPQNKLVMWCVPGMPGTLWIYNFELDRWTTAKLVIEGVFPGFTNSTTLDDLTVTYPDIDAMGISLDDPRWEGGNPRLYGVRAGVVGTFFGQALPVTFQYGFNEMTKHRRARIRDIRLTTDAIVGNAVSLDVMQRMGDAPRTVAAGNMRVSGVLPVRAAGKYCKPRWTISAGSVWTYAQGMEFEVEAGGER